MIRQFKADTRIELLRLGEMNELRSHGYKVNVKRVRIKYEVIVMRSSKVVKKVEFWKIALQISLFYFLELIFLHKVASRQLAEEK